MDVKMLSIDSIGLSNRSKNALHRAEIHTVGDMLVHTEESLNEIRNLGKKSIEEILIKIDEYRKFDEKKRDSESWLLGKRSILSIFFCSANTTIFIKLCL